MQRRTFAPMSKSFQVPNPEIDFARCPMQVQTECEPFPEHPVVVGINSFGFGGANGHCVVREYRPARPRLWSMPLALEPAGLSMEEAASSLSVYVTACYALIHLARLRKGQRVLIHSAMGGIGQAAIALANNVGAEVYATAGSESKRDALLALGVQAAFDSHSEDWYEGLLKATAGQGLDVVLNSLAGRHVALCLQALRSGGWYCEIGKIDIYADSALGLRVFRKNLRFAAIDLDRLMVDDPLLSRELSEACLDLLDRGVVPPCRSRSSPTATTPRRFAS